MQGHEIPLAKFIEGNRMRFIIPVYQRNYDWKIENCNQLFNDLKKLHVSGRQNHFFGSIVSSTADSIGYDRLVIDGQQRLTTISLLLLAAIHAVKAGKLEVSDMSRLDEANDIYLTARYCSSERKIKLVPIEKDLEAFDLIFKEDFEHLIESSKVTRNYKHFYTLLTADNKPFTFDVLLDSISKLQIITIELQDTDDPQLIFESLNSTGLALSEADKIRNYLLMSLSAADQQTCFKNYWQKIEISTGGDPTMFLRDYITIIEQFQRPVRIDNLYFEWKKYMEGHDRKEELANMLDYANLYYQVTAAKMSTPKLCKKMQQLCNLETDTMNLFLIPFMKYSSENAVSEDEIWKVLDVIENYMARRIICNMPSNALTQVYCALHKDVVKSIKEYSIAEQPLDCSYSDILVYHVMRRDGAYILPRDIQLKESIAHRDAYHMLKPFQRFLFERLENSSNKEFIDVAKEMRSSEATLEHIMPQTLTQEWRRMLGEKAEEIHETYLHTFANLTLTGVNTELSNHSFEDKKNGKEIKGEMCDGYISSKYRLTKDIIRFDKWTEDELNERARIMENKILALYPLPTTSFKPLPKPVEEVTLDTEGFDAKGRRIVRYNLLGEQHEETIWVSFYINVVKTLFERFPDQMETLINSHYLWTEDRQNPSYCTKISDNLYLWCSMSNSAKINGLRFIFDTIDLAQSELSICIEPLKKAEGDE